MKMVSLVIGSVGQVHIQQQYLRCFSLLPATVTATTAMPTVEATTASIGHRDLTKFLTAPLTPTASSSSAAISICTTSATALTGTLSVASRNNKSLRSVDLKNEVGVIRPNFLNVQSRQSISRVRSVKARRRESVSSAAYWWRNHRSKI